MKMYLNHDDLELLRRALGYTLRSTSNQLFVERVKERELLERLIQALKDDSADE